MMLLASNDGVEDAWLRMGEVNSEARPFMEIEAGF